MRIPISSHPYQFFIAFFFVIDILVGVNVIVLLTLVFLLANDVEDCYMCLFDICGTVMSNVYSAHSLVLKSGCFFIVQLRIFLYGVVDSYQINYLQISSLILCVVFSHLKGVL